MGVSTIYARVSVVDNYSLKRLFHMMHGGMKGDIDAGRQEKA
jgi:hypothetical protein